MKIHYFRSDPPNFGDELNAYIWAKLLPDGFFDGREPTFLGVGTLLTHHLQEKEYWVLGTGAGYGALPSPNTKLRYFAVRGPETAKALGLPGSMAVTDSALFLRRVWPQYCKPQEKIFSFGYIPHFSQHMAYGDILRWCCSVSGIEYLSPCDPVEQTIEKISQTKVLLAEAMHGAIVADCVGTPWIPIKAHRGVNSFKWQDWCHSVSLEYKPYRIRKIGSVLKLSGPLRFSISTAFAAQLRIVCARTVPILSSRSKLRENEIRLSAALDELIHAWREAQSKGSMHD